MANEDQPGFSDALGGGIFPSPNAELTILKGYAGATWLNHHNRKCLRITLSRLVSPLNPQPLQLLPQPLAAQAQFLSRLLFVPMILLQCVLDHASFDVVDDFVDSFAGERERFFLTVGLDRLARPGRGALRRS